MFIQILINCLYFLVYSQGFSNSKAAINILSFFPALAYDFSFLKSGIVFYTGSIEYSLNKGYWFLAIDSLLYLILFLYVDKVIPN
jgi:hypothetical protein